MKNFAMVSLIAASLLPALPARSLAAQVDEPFCWMQMRDRMLDLTSLCAGGGDATIAAAPSEVQILNWRYDADGYIVGRLRNNTANEIQFVQVGYEVYDRAGRLLDSGSFYTDRQAIEPGGTSAFSFPPRGDGDRVVLTEVTWR